MLACWLAGALKTLQCKLVSRRESRNSLGAKEEITQQTQTVRKSSPTNFLEHRTVWSEKSSEEGLIPCLYLLFKAWLSKCWKKVQADEDDDEEGGEFCPFRIVVIRLGSLSLLSDSVSTNP